jgi:hypothetical protein
MSYPPFIFYIKFDYGVFHIYRPCVIKLNLYLMVHSIVLKFEKSWLSHILNIIRKSKKSLFSKRKKGHNSWTVNVKYTVIKLNIEYKRGVTHIGVASLFYFFTIALQSFKLGYLPFLFCANALQSIKLELPPFYNCEKIKKGGSSNLTPI